jgi:hypothetical protein
MTLINIVLVHHPTLLLPKYLVGWNEGGVRVRFPVYVVPISETGRLETPDWSDAVAIVNAHLSN